MTLVINIPKQDIGLFTSKGYIVFLINAIVIAAFAFGIVDLVKANALTNLLFFGRKIKKGKGL